MIWVLIQAVFFVLIFLLQYSSDFTAPGWAMIAALIAKLLAIFIGVVAIYNLHHSLSVSPTPIKNGRLETQGIYSYIRHPMYSAVMLLSLGVAISSGSYIKLVLAIVIVVFFNLKARHEEKLLAAKYPGYNKYQSDIGRFCPKFSRVMHFIITSGTKG